MGSKSELQHRVDRKINRYDIEDSTNEYRSRKSPEFHEKVNRRSAGSFKENDEKLVRNVILKTPDKEEGRGKSTKSPDSLKEYNDYLSERQVNRTPENNEGENPRIFREGLREHNPLSPKNETFQARNYDHNKNIKISGENNITESSLRKSPDDKKRFSIETSHKSLDGERSSRTPDSDKESKKLETRRLKTSEFELDERHKREPRTHTSESRKSPNNIREYGDDTFEKRMQDRRKSPDGIPRSQMLKTPDRSTKKLESEEGEILHSGSLKTREKAKDGGNEKDGKSLITPPKSRTFKSPESDKSSRKKLLYEFGTSVDMDDGDVPDNDVKSQSWTPDKEGENRNTKDRKTSSNLTKSQHLKSPELRENDKKKLQESDNLHRDDNILETRPFKKLSDGRHTKSPGYEQRLNQRTKSSESIPDGVMSPDGEKSGDNEERTDRKTVKSPVYLAELNKTLSERQRRTKKNVDGMEKKEQNDVDSLLAACFEDLHGSEMSTPTHSGKDKEKYEKEKRERRRKGEHTMNDQKINVDKHKGKTKDKSKDRDNEKVKSSNNKMKDKTVEDKEKRRKKDMRRKSGSSSCDSEKEKSTNDKTKDNTEDKEKRRKKEFMKKRSGSSSSDSERRTDSGGEDKKSMKKKYTDTKPTFSELMATKQNSSKLTNTESKVKEPTFSELMAMKKNSSVVINTESKGKDGIILPKESKERSPHRKKSKELNDKFNSGINDSEILDDIFKENNSPKTKTLQRQIHVSGGNGAAEEEEIRMKDVFDGKKDDGKKKGFKDEVDTSSSKLKGASSFDDLTNPVLKERSSSNLSKRKSMSATNISHFSSSPKKDKSLNKSTSHRKITPSRNDATFTVPSNSADLKEIIYHQWLEKKKVQTKEEIKAKLLARKKAAQQAEAEANDRKHAAQKIYEAWNDSKSGQILTEKETRQKVKKAEKVKIEESVQKRKDAEKYFEAWKREKDTRIKKMHSQKKKEDKQKDKESFKLKRQTSEEALKAFESWKTQKTKECAEMKKMDEEEKAKQGEEKLLAFEKKQEALRVYENWKCNIKKSPRPQSPQLTQRSWLPAGRNLNNTIPEQVQPVIIRNRNVSN